MLFDNMLTGTDQNSDSVSFHKDSVLFHLISQRSDFISILISCQAWTRSFCLGLVSSHPSPTPGRDKTGTKYSDSGDQSTSSSQSSDVFHKKDNHQMSQCNTERSCLINCSISEENQQKEKSEN